MSTGGSARIIPSRSKQVAAPPKPSTDPFEDPVQKELPAIVISQWKPPASQPRAKKDRPRSVNPDGNWGADREDATQVHLDLSQRHTDTTPHSKIRRVTFNIPSGRHRSPSPEVAEVTDANVEMGTAQNIPAERAPSFEIMTEAEYQASLEFQHHSSGMTFKKEPTDNIGLRVDNVGCFLRSLDANVEMATARNIPAERAPSFEIMTEAEYQASLESQHHSSGMTFKKEPTDNIGLRVDNSREHLRKLVNRVNDKERMEELRKLLQSQKVPITVWWEIFDGLSTVAANHQL
ncbi:hypothetical protein C0995_012952 [Termitomyces sp. Mi166|nr:hypothetical protein C0995_012952 [Termitomyces sp. Mi166\